VSVELVLSLNRHVTPQLSFGDLQLNGFLEAQKLTPAVPFLELPKDIATKRGEDLPGSALPSCKISHRSVDQLHHQQSQKTANLIPYILCMASNIKWHCYVQQQKQKYQCLSETSSGIGNLEIKSTQQYYVHYCSTISDITFQLDKFLALSSTHLC